MSTFMAFILGLIVGWVIEWIIDWVYWRRRSWTSTQHEDMLRERLEKVEAQNAELERQLSLQKANQASLQEKLSAAEAELSAAKASSELAARSQVLPDVEPTPVRSMPIIHDDLEVIKGIGPVIAKKLNAVGIYSFAELAALTPERLRELVGDVISRLADEDSIIEQAKQLAAHESQGG